MDPDLSIQIVALVILLILSAFFSSAETALVSTNKIRMRTLADEGNARAKLVLKILDNQAKMLSAILIGNNLVNTAAASIATTIAYSFGGAAVGIATFIITLLILIFGEITPKTMATERSEKMALFYARIIAFLMSVLTPVIVFINAFSFVILRLFGAKSDANRQTLTESELRTIVDVSHEEGVIEKDEKEMINKVFDLGDTKAKDVMVPRVHVVMAKRDSTYQELIELFREEQFTRIPIYDGSTDNIIGLVNMKDLLLYQDLNDFHIDNILRKPYFTYENKSVSDLLFEMKYSTFNLAIVLDEYGEMVGIITVEDIVEEIVGDVHDEYDAQEEEKIKQISENVYEIKGYISLHDLNSALHLDLNSENFDSIGGLVIDSLGRLPKLNDSIVLENGILIEVIALEKNRIEQVRLTLPKKETEDEER